MAKEFIPVFKPEEISERVLPSRIRIKGANHEHTEKIKNVRQYADLLYRMRLTCELHNRDHVDDPYELQEERDVPAEVPK